MNLRWVHAVLIMLSAALAVLFGVWCLSVYGRQGGTGLLVAAVEGVGNAVPGPASPRHAQALEHLVDRAAHMQQHRQVVLAG